MNAIPLVFNAPKANINVNSVRPVNANPNKMNMGGAAGMLGGGGLSNEAQLRQEVNTSIVALKREAFSLETLIAQAAQTLQDVNKRLSELEGKQGDYVKKADVTVASVGGDGKYISAISETDGKINATATDLGNMVPVNSVTSGNMHSVTSGAVYEKLGNTTGWTYVAEGVYYKIRNGICTVQIDLNSGYFNENGTMSIATLPQEARPTRALQMPASVYGVSGTPSYNQTQTWLRVGTSGSLTFISGLVTKDVTECHATATYCLSN